LINSKFIAVALEPMMKPSNFTNPHPSLDTNNQPIDFGPPSRVIVLRNITLPGSVDESLDEEIGIECSKHGEVTDVVIFEATEPDFPEEEAVRVYVEFNDVAAAEAALRALHGRFFGGRVVKAKYFDEGRFKSGELAPRAAEDF
jgi:splicing factor 45